MKQTVLRLFFLGVAALILIQPNQAPAAALQWISVGPEGGDARSFAYDPADPSHIYMGTTMSWIYQSTDGGTTWKRLARLGKVDDLVVDNMVIDSSDPKTIYAGVWRLDRTDGGIYISHDGGATWAASADMDGKVYARSLPGPVGSEDSGGGCDQRRLPQLGLGSSLDADQLPWVTVRFSRLSRSLSIL